MTPEQSALLGAVSNYTTELRWIREQVLDLSKSSIGKSGLVLSMLARQLDFLREHFYELLGNGEELARMVSAYLEHGRFEWQGDQFKWQMEVISLMHALRMTRELFQGQNRTS